MLKPFAERLGAVAPSRVMIVIGPEGGFTAREIEQLEAAGAVSIGLGRRIFRTETAGMAALTCIMYETGEMGES
ncbi:Ribosomal RNA small subunit methyltransferase E [compost metagenome]